MRLRTLTAVCVLTAASLAAHAQPITYSLSGLFSGSLAGSSFADTSITFNVYGDTTAAAPIFPGFYANSGDNLIFLSGYHVLTTRFPLYAESEYNTAAFYDFHTGFAIGDYSDAIADYDLRSAIGPVKGTFASTGTIALSTNYGDLKITGATGDVTYSAVVFTPTPEPSSLLLLSTGLLGTAVAVRRRFVRA